MPGSAILTIELSSTVMQMEAETASTAKMRRGIGSPSSSAAGAGRGGGAVMDAGVPGAGWTSAGPARYAIDGA